MAGLWRPFENCLDDGYDVNRDVNSSNADFSMDQSCLSAEVLQCNESGDSKLDYRLKPIINIYEYGLSEGKFISENNPSLQVKYFPEISPNVNITSEKIEVSSKSYKCDLCSKTFKKRNALRIHKRGVHMKLKPFKCEFCDYKFSVKSNLNRHYRSVHEKTKPFQCDLCDQKFDLKQLLDRHIISIHKNCGLCEIQFHKNTKQRYCTSAEHKKMTYQCSRKNI